MKVLSRRNVNRLTLAAICVAFLLLTALPLYAAQVTLAWDPVSPAPDGYRVYRSTTGTNYNYSAPSWTGSAATCTVGNLADSTTYKFVVRAYEGSTESSNSNEVSYRYDPVAQNYTINASAGANGTISPSGAVSVANGANRSFSITPASGYQVADVLVDGASVGAVTAYAFSNINANHTISASFAATSTSSYRITASAGQNGTISPSGQVTVARGGSQTFSITPNTNCYIANVVVNGQSIGQVSTYTFRNVTSNNTISATFGANSYTVAASAGSGGTIQPSGAISLNAGASQNFSIQANENYRIKDVLVDGVSVGKVASYSFSGISADHSIVATFEPLTSDAESLIIDDGEPGTSANGSWSRSYAPNPYGRRSLQSNVMGADYTFSAMIAGRYEVAIWWTAYTSRSSAVPVEIWDGDSLLDVVEVNQRQDGGQWNVLGTYDFSDHAEIVIVAEGGYWTSADAVRFNASQGSTTPPGGIETVIVDDGDQGTSAQGAWSSYNDSGAYGQRTMYTSISNATYTYEASVNGTCEIAMWWTTHSTCGTAVPVEIWDGNRRLDVVQVNQQRNGAQWNVLGTYDFADHPRVVVVSSGGYNTGADAVRFNTTGY